MTIEQLAQSVTITTDVSRIITVDEELDCEYKRRIDYEY